jgi:uracil-DNA glycosylase
VPGAEPTPPERGSLQALQAAHRACIRCVDGGLLAAANPVFSGRPGQRILLVGQAPGPVENDGQRPFAGRAGRQLMRWFERGGFAGDADVRRRVYMTSMTTCFPGRTPDGRGDRRPSAREVALCAGWLDGVLALLRPRLVLPIGTLALARFVPGTGLEAAVGRLFDASGAEAEVGDRVPLLLPLPHPSGQSRWLNESAHIARLEQAIARLPDLVTWAESG